MVCVATNGEDIQKSDFESSLPLPFQVRGEVYAGLATPRADPKESVRRWKSGKPRSISAGRSEEVQSDKRFRVGQQPPIFNMTRWLSGQRQRSAKSQIIGSNPIRVSKFTDNEISRPCPVDTSDEMGAWIRQQEALLAETTPP